MSKKGDKYREKKRLKAYYDDIRKKREAIAEKNAPFLDRVKAIMDAPRVARLDFWCTVCKKDCTGPGYRQVATIRERVPTAWYVAFCPQGHRMIRRITDKSDDPYYYQSMFLQRQRMDMAMDLLTPDDPRFRILYPKQWEELYGKKQRAKN